MSPVTTRELKRLRDTLAEHEVEYLLLGKMAAIIQGYPDTTQDADLFVEKSVGNGKRLTAALRELGFKFSPEEQAEIENGKDFVQLRSGPFDLDVVHAPDGIERYDDARQRGLEVDGFPVCSIQDIIESKRRAGRSKDRETLPRLRSFATYLESNPPPNARPLPPKKVPMPAARPPAPRPRSSTKGRGYDR